MLCADGYEYFYSYGFILSYYLPANEAPVINIRKYDYEDLGGVYVYDIDEYAIRDYDLDDTIFHLNSSNTFYVECIKKYDDLEDEEDIKFVEDAKQIYNEALSEVIGKFKLQLNNLEDALNESTIDEDKNFIIGNIKYTKGIINNLNKLKSLEPKITYDL